MKKFINTTLFIFLISGYSFAQNINWESLNDNRNNLVYAGFGYDYGAVARIGYSRVFQLALPVAALIDYSFPMGNNIADDFKARCGGKIEALKYDHFSLTAGIFGNFRRHQTELTRIEGFGAEFSALAGYYRAGWNVGVEFGFDKSVITNIKNSAIMTENYPGIENGWYIPSGGNYFYGVTIGKTIGRSFDLSFRIGATNAQGKDTNAILPYFAQAGIMKRF